MAETRQSVRKDEISETSSQSLFSDENSAIFLIVCYGAVCQIINVFGIGTNIINIICFLRQGFKEPINVSLLGLTISDLASLIPVLTTGIFLMRPFQQLDLTFDTMDMSYILTFPRLAFTRISCSITAFIMLEKCLCITMPLKVGNLFTSKRVTVIIVCIYLALFGCSTPGYLTGTFGMKFYPEKNRTLLGFIFSEKRVLLEQISFGINLFVIPFCALTIVIACMIIISSSLRKQAKWRSSLVAVTKTDAILKKEIKVAQLVVMISSLFVACYTPTAIAFLAIAIWPDLAYFGKYQHVSIILIGVGQILESLNSSVNIFIYYRMSSKYKMYFQKLFSMNEIE